MKSKQVKRQEAQQRLIMWQSLTREMQLRSLDDRLGAGIGARKQRTRLARVSRS